MLFLMQAVLVASDCNPRWLTKHLPGLAASRRVPLIFVRDRKEGSLRLGGLVKLKTAIAIGVKVITLSSFKTSSSRDNGNCIFICFCLLCRLKEVGSTKQSRKFLATKSQPEELKHRNIAEHHHLTCLLERRGSINGRSFQLLKYSNLLC